MEKRSVKTKMLRVRAQVMLVHRLSGQLKEFEPGIQSPAMTGMPKAPGRPARGIDCHLARKDALQRILERECALLRSYEREARAEMDRMRPEMYAFCSLYYLGGITVEETAEMLGRCRRQCLRYKKDIEGETEEETEETEETEEETEGTEKTEETGKSAQWAG